MTIRKTLSAVEALADVSTSRSKLSLEGLVEPSASRFPENTRNHGTYA
jgi:hypothetical protein